MKFVCSNVPEQGPEACRAFLAGLQRIQVAVALGRRAAEDQFLKQVGVLQ